MDLISIAVIFCYALS